MNDLVRKKKPAACPQLCLMLMRRFQAPVPGVRLCRVHFEGYADREIRRSFRYLLRRRVLDAQVAHDASGDRYAGYLVSLSPLGRLVLKTVDGGIDHSPASAE